MKKIISVLVFLLFCGIVNAVNPGDVNYISISIMDDNSTMHTLIYNDTNNPWANWILIPEFRQLTLTTYTGYDLTIYERGVSLFSRNALTIDAAQVVFNNGSNYYANASIDWNWLYDGVTPTKPAVPDNDTSKMLYTPDGIYPNFGNYSNCGVNCYVYVSLTEYANYSATTTTTTTTTTSTTSTTLPTNYNFCFNITDSITGAPLWGYSLLASAIGYSSMATTNSSGIVTLNFNVGTYYKINGFRYNDYANQIFYTDADSLRLAFDWALSDTPCINLHASAYNNSVTTTTLTPTTTTLNGNYNITYNFYDSVNSETPTNLSYSLDCDHFITASDTYTGTNKYLTSPTSPLRCDVRRADTEIYDIKNLDDGLYYQTASYNLVEGPNMIYVKKHVSTYNTSNNSGDFYNVGGYVSSGGQMLDDANIHLSVNGHPFSDDKRTVSGYYLFYNIPKGSNIALVVTKSGYEGKSYSYAGINKDSSTRFNFTLLYDDESGNGGTSPPNTNTRDIYTCVYAKPDNIPVTEVNIILSGNGITKYLNTLTSNCVFFRDVEDNVCYSISANKLPYYDVYGPYTQSDCNKINEDIYLTKVSNNPANSCYITGHTYIKNQSVIQYVPSTVCISREDGFNSCYDSKIDGIDDGYYILQNLACDKTYKIEASYGECTYKNTVLTSSQNSEGQTVHDTAISCGLTTEQKNLLNTIWEKLWYFLAVIVAMSGFCIATPLIIFFMFVLMIGLKIAEEIGNTLGLSGGMVPIMIIILILIIIGMILSASGIAAVIL